MIVQIPFVGHAYADETKPLSIQECVNYYPEVAQQDARAIVSLKKTPGLSLWTTIGSGPIRGIWDMGDNAYVVSGTELYKVSSNKTATLLGTILGSGVVSMADNGSELVIVNGANGYFYSESLGFSIITDTDFYGADVVQYIDGYFVFNRSGTSQFFSSDLYSGLTYLGTDFASAEGWPDKIVSILIINRRIWLLGEETTDVWWNTAAGGSGFPFSRIEGSFMHRGCGAARSPAIVDNAIIWLGEDKIVYIAQGYAPQRISTHPLEQEFSSYSTISDAYAYSYTQDGHKFYVLTFPTAGKTWVYDMSTGLWHRRKSYNITRHRVSSYRWCFGKHLVGDYANGNVYEYSRHSYTDNGAPIERIRSTPYVHSNQKPFTINRLQVHMDMGQGLVGTVDPSTVTDPLAIADGQFPYVSLEYTKDGGRTWSTKKLASVGPIGDYSRRAIWRRLGKAYNIAFRLTDTSPTPGAIIDAVADISPGTSV